MFFAESVQSCSSKTVQFSLALTIGTHPEKEAQFEYLLSD